MMNLTSEAPYQRIKGGDNVSLIFDDEESFSLMGLKIMQAHSKESFLRCAKIRYNGQLKLIYFVEYYQNLPTILSSIQPSRINSVLCQLLAGLLHIRQNGFLSYENIIISPEDIYLDSKTFEPKFIYVPLTIKDSYERKLAFEADLRTNLCNCIKRYSQTIVDNTISMLMDSSFELEQILKELQKNTKDQPIEKKGNNEKTGLLLTCKEAGMQFNICKSPFSFGRNKECDAVIDISNAVSRVHFKLIRDKEGWNVIDEKSRYGTFLNNKECARQQIYSIKDGDTIRIWELVFRVNYI